MTAITHTTDEKARIHLPKTFANSTVLVEQVSDTELRIRKARVIPEDELPFVEEAMAPLSDRDRDVFLALLDDPPPPNDALRHLLTSGQGAQRQTAARPFGDPIDPVSLQWPEFLAQVRAEQHPVGHPLMQERLHVLREIRHLFSQEVHFNELGYPERQKIAGLMKSRNPDFLLFGSMRAVGRFKQAILNNNDEISLALDEIPWLGEITRDQYQRFTVRFLKAFERAGMALASRLLAMKRPDTFVCVNNENRQGLFQAFRLIPNRSPERYWELIEKVQTSTWWQAPQPAGGDEREVWIARAAFLDALFYTGVGM